MEVDTTLLQLSPLVERDTTAAEKSARLLARALPQNDALRRRHFALPSPSPVPDWPTPQQRVVQASATANQFYDSFAFDPDQRKVVPGTWDGVIEDAGTKRKRTKRERGATSEAADRAGLDGEHATSDVSRPLNLDSVNSGRVDAHGADADEAVGTTRRSCDRRQRRRLHGETSTAADAATARAAVADTSSSSHAHIQALLDRERSLNELKNNETLVFALQECVAHDKGQDLEVSPALLLGILQNRNQLLRRVTGA